MILYFGQFLSKNTYLFEYKIHITNINNRCIGKNPKLEVRILPFVQKPRSTEKVNAEKECNPRDFTLLTRCNDPFFPNAEDCPARPGSTFFLV